MADPVTAMMAASMAVSASGTLMGGQAEQQASSFEAAQLEASGQSAFASSQRQANEERRQAQLAISRARAVGAGSGGGVDVTGLGNLGAEGEYRALTALYEGREAMAGRQMQAAASRFEGDTAKTASYFDAGGTLIDGGRSLAKSPKVAAWFDGSNTLMAGGRSMQEKYG